MFERARSKFLCLFVCCGCGVASLSNAAQSLSQTPAPLPEQIVAPASGSPASAQPGLTLEQAIAAAMANDPAYASSVAAAGSARLDHSVARSALLPNGSLHGAYIYSQPNGVYNQAGQIGSQAAPRFIVSNAIREYATEFLANETLSVGEFADLRRTRALALESAADLESARRDLVRRVVQEYFGLLAAQNKLEVARQALAEADGFVALTQKLEGGREVAHADVVKAELVQQQRQREWQDSSLEAQRAGLDLGTLLFADPRTPYSLAPSGPEALAAEPAIEAAAAENNPDLRSALEALRAAHAAVQAARAAYLPTLSFNYTYGIDAPELAVNGPEHVRNLGYSASGSIDLPVWNWFATHDRVKQSQYQEAAAKVALSATQRTLIAQLEEFYREAQIANEQLASLANSVKTAQDSLRLTKLRYTAGEASALEVVDAENMLAQVQASLADGQLRYRVALANLQTLTGVL
jgi:outer membrane protein